MHSGGRRYIIRLRTMGYGTASCQHHPWPCKHVLWLYPQTPWLLKCQHAFNVDTTYGFAILQTQLNAGVDNLFGLSVKIPQCLPVKIFVCHQAKNGGGGAMRMSLDRHTGRTWAPMALSASQRLVSDPACVCIGLGVDHRHQSSLLPSFIPLAPVILPASQGHSSAAWAENQSCVPSNMVWLIALWHTSWELSSPGLSQTETQLMEQ